MGYLGVLSWIISELLFELAPIQIIIFVQLLPILLLFNIKNSQENKYGSRQGKSNFFDSIFTCFDKFFDFKGRASRSEYWYFVLFVTALGTLINKIEGSSTFFTGIFTTIFYVITFFPLIAVEVRRLHDINRVGYWIFLEFLPIVGTLIILYWKCLKADDYLKSEQSSFSNLQFNNSDENSKPTIKNVHYSNTVKNNVLTQPFGQQINPDFEKAVEFFPHLAEEYNSLTNYGVEVQKLFTQKILETKSFNKSDAILNDIIDNELSRLFGDNIKIKMYGKYLIENRLNLKIEQLRDTMRILGETVNPDDIINKIESRSLFKYKPELKEKFIQINCNDISELSVYSTIIRKENGLTESQKIYLAKIKDGQYLGYNPNSFKYEFFVSKEQYSQRTFIFYKYFSVTENKKDCEDFINIITNLFKI